MRGNGIDKDRFNDDDDYGNVIIFQWVKRKSAGTRSIQMGTYLKFKVKL